MSESIIDRLRDEVSTRYGADATDVHLVRSPLRICPLGAHIDHQLGPVTAMAIDRAVHLGYVAADGPGVQLSSLSFSGEVSFQLNDIPQKQDGDWGNYVRGAAGALNDFTPLSRGILGVTQGAHGEGGLSSSAAVGIAYLLALEEANGLQVSPEQNVELDRLIENGYLGLKNGILDPSAILHSRKDHLTCIDCRTGSSRTIARSPEMPPFAILVAFSGVRQALTSTGYNSRVSECAQAASHLLKAAGRADDPPLLGNISPDEYKRHKGVLSGASAKRARHFFTECERVRQGITAWESGDLPGFGRLMSESGRSSVVNYECGSEPLIDLYNVLCEQDGVYGARFSGAGFRGCCIALVTPGMAEQIREDVAVTYAKRHPDLAKDAPCFICESDDGARFVD